MNALTWEEFYQKYFDWSERTVANNIKHLTSIGSAEEVSEVLLGIVDYPKAVADLLQMAIDEKLALPFTDLVELYDYCEGELLAHAVELCYLDDQNSGSLTGILGMVEKGPLFDAILNKARNCGVGFRAADLEELDNVDQSFKKETLEKDSLKDMDVDEILALMDNYSDDQETLHTIIEKAYRAKKRPKLSDLLFLDGACDTGHFIRMVERSLVDDMDSFVDIITDYAWNQKAVEILADKILKERILFTGKQLEFLDGAFDDATMTKIVLQSSEQFEQQDIDTLAFLVPDPLIVEICNKRGLRLPEGVIDQEAEMEQLRREESQRKTGGFLGGFIAGLLGKEPDIPHPNSGKGRNPRKKMQCTGDCANCPPHYGYRYGRWYYGRCHQYGCELGGNRGDGAYD